jgi:gamma-butyrobetaine dioxygenase
MRLTRDDSYRLNLKMDTGDMLVFDNRRVLHGREAFDPNSGQRHLHGCYVDRVEFDSRLRLLG